MAVEAKQIAERLRQRMLRVGISTAELAKRARVKPSFIYDMMSGKSTNPSVIKLAQLAEQLNVPVTYLVEDRQLVALDDGRENAYPSEHVAIAVMTPDGWMMAENHDKTRDTEAGVYFFRRDWVQVHLRAAPADLRVVFITGDGMRPGLCHGDMALVDLRRTLPTPPGIFLLYDGLGLLPKRLELTGSGDNPTLRIISDNAQYGAYERHPDDVKIVGRVIWFGRVL